jgi:hypothetical protein
MAATPKPVRKAVKEFSHSVKGTNLSKKEKKKEIGLAKSKYSVSSPKHKKTVASDLRKMSREVRRSK